MPRSLYFAVFLFFTTFAYAQTPRAFLGGGPGVSALSGAAGANFAPSAASLSSYDPKFGALVHVFGGWNFAEYLSVQAAWSANRNELIFQSSAPNNVFYQQRRKSSQKNLGGDLLLFFRDRKSAIRPFLSAGINEMWFRSEPTELIASSGSPLPPPAYRDTAVGFRVAAGTDVIIKHGWGFRYAFMEHLQQRNVIGLKLTPPADRQLMNFQHLFGVVKYF